MWRGKESSRPLRVITMCAAYDADMALQNKSLVTSDDCEHVGLHDQLSAYL